MKKEKEPKNLKGYAITQVQHETENIKIMIGLLGLIDFTEEKSRLQKQLQKLNKQLDQLKNKLDNKNFIQKAPSDVIHQYKDQLQQVENKIESNKKALHRLSL